MTMCLTGGKSSIGRKSQDSSRQEVLTRVGFYSFLCHHKLVLNKNHFFLGKVQFIFKEKLKGVDTL